ncbi:hypothetical protein BC628DRAFT_375526 [Trametes gibbosa]|nr:hypothetical protein BC628DRAFT_375526 [Trametes gibbosa]
MGPSPASARDAEGCPWFPLREHVAVRSFPRLALALRQNFSLLESRAGSLGTRSVKMGFISPVRGATRSRGRVMSETEAGRGAEGLVMLMSSAVSGPLGVRVRRSSVFCAQRVLSPVDAHRRRLPPAAQSLLNGGEGPLSTFGTPLSIPPPPRPIGSIERALRPAYKSRLAIHAPTPLSYLLLLLPLLLLPPPTPPPTTPPLPPTTTTSCHSSSFPAPTYHRRPHGSSIQKLLPR